jgi:hypothetical protein
MRIFFSAISITDYSWNKTILGWDCDVLGVKLFKKTFLTQCYTELSTKLHGGNCRKLSFENLFASCKLSVKLCGTFVNSVVKFTIYIINYQHINQQTNFTKSPLAPPSYSLLLGVWRGLPLCRG